MKPEWTPFVFDQITMALLAEHLAHKNRFFKTSLYFYMQ